MSVRKVREGVFDIDIRQGKDESLRLRKRVFCASQLDAIAMEADLKKQLNRPGKQAWTVGYVAEKYLPWMDNHQSPKTALDKKKMLMGRILPFFGHIVPDRINAQMIETYKNKRLQDAGGRKINRMINLELLCLQAMLKWGHVQGLCNEPGKKFSPLPYKRKLPDIPEPDDICLLYTSDAADE